MEPGFPGGSTGESPAAPSNGAVSAPYGSQYSPGYGTPPESGAPGQPYPSTEGEAQPGQSPEWASQLAAAEARAQAAEAEAARHRQEWGEMQQWFSQVELAAQHQQRQTQAETRMNQAYAHAADMDPENAQLFLRNFHNAENAAHARELEEVRLAEQARTRAVAETIALPTYVRDQVKARKIADEFVPILEGQPAHLIDSALQMAELFSQQKAAFGQQVEQLGRSAGAAQMTASGAFNPAGNGAAPGSPGDERLNPRSPNYDSDLTIKEILRRRRGR
jgi:hypothetical protein